MSKAKKKKKSHRGVNYFTCSSYQLNEIPKHHAVVSKALADALLLSQVLFLLI